MVTSKNIETLENSQVKLTITVGAEEAKKEYSKLLNKYSKSAHIKGFRKGKVPAAVLETKYGESIRGEAAMTIMEESLKEAYEDIEKKPLGYAAPTLQDEENTQLELGKEFTFTVVYDTFPEFEVPAYTGIEIEQPEVKVLKKDLDRELEKIQDQNSMVIEKDARGSVAKKNIVTIDFVEVDEKDEPVEGTAREDFVFTVGTGYNLYKIDDDILKMKKDGEKIIEKEYPEDFENKDLAGRKLRLKVKVKAIKQKDLPAIDDELAQDVSEKFETLDDLKNDIKGKLEKQRDETLRSKNIEAVMEKIIESAEIAIPDSMLDAELNSSWYNFLGQYRMEESQMLKMLEIQNKSKEEFLEEWKPDAVKRIKSTLLTNEIIKAEKVEISDEDIDNFYKEQAESTNQSEEEIKKLYEEKNYLDYLKDELKHRKVYDLILSKTKIKKGEKIDFIDLVGQQNQ